MTRLIMIEGVPGTGKSTTAQAVAAALREAGRPVRWHHEEEVGHPVYLYADDAGLEAVIADLRASRFDDLIFRALAAWEKFAAGVLAGREVIVIDACLLGYLTWSLFSAGARSELIVDYVAAVERILAPLQPLVIYLRAPDMGAIWDQLEASRGKRWMDDHVVITERSAYARRRRLSGRDGVIGFWTEYQELADHVAPEATLRFDVDVRDRDGGQRDVVRTLGLHMPEPRRVAADEREGCYEDGEGRMVEVARAGGEEGLAVRGLPGRTSVVPLLPAGPDCFDLRGFPLRLVFDRDGFDVRGPRLLGGRRPGRFVRRSGGRG